MRFLEKRTFFDNTFVNIKKNLQNSKNVYPEIETIKNFTMRNVQEAIFIVYSNCT